MNTTIGIQNEENFVKELDNKLFGELNKNLQMFLFYLFPNIDKTARFHCYMTENFCKPDIVIYQNDQYRYVSVKYGQAETVHNENIMTFIEFLRDCQISEETIESYLLYHFGDGTKDGTGKRRMDSVETRFTYDDRIKKMNEEFNSSKAFIKGFADRTMFQGVNPQASRADYLYHGDPDKGVFISRDQVMKHIDRKDWSFMNRCVHIGPLIVRPHARYAGKEILNEKHRHTVAVNYPGIVSDMLYIQNRYNFRNISEKNKELLR